MTPSPGAMRAAKAIQEDVWHLAFHGDKGKDLAHFGRIIDRETHAAELLAALKWAMHGMSRPLQRENAKLIQALEECAIALNCMTGLASRNEHHRERARQVVDDALGHFRTILPADPTAFAEVEKPKVSPTEDR